MLNELGEPNETFPWSMLSDEVLIDSCNAELSLLTKNNSNYVQAMNNISVNDLALTTTISPEILQQATSSVTSTVSPKLILIIIIRKDKLKL